MRPVAIRFFPLQGGRSMGVDESEFSEVELMHSVRLRRYLYMFEAFGLPSDLASVIVNRFLGGESIQQRDISFTVKSRPKLERSFTREVSRENKQPQRQDHQPTWDRESVPTLETALEVISARLPPQGTEFSTIQKSTTVSNTSSAHPATSDTDGSSPVANSSSSQMSIRSKPVSSSPTEKRSSSKMATSDERNCLPVSLDRSDILGGQGDSGKEITNLSWYEHMAESITVLSSNRKPGPPESWIIDKPVCGHNDDNFWSSGEEESPKQFSSPAFSRSLQECPDYRHHSSQSPRPPQTQSSQQQQRAFHNQPLQGHSPLEKQPHDAKDLSIRLAENAQFQVMVAMPIQLMIHLITQTQGFIAYLLDLESIEPGILHKETLSNVANGAGLDVQFGQHFLDGTKEVLVLIRTTNTQAMTKILKGITSVLANDERQFRWYNREEDEEVYKQRVIWEGSYRELMDLIARVSSMDDLRAVLELEIANEFGLGGDRIYNGSNIDVSNSNNLGTSNGHAEETEDWHHSSHSSLESDDWHHQ